MKSWLKPGPRDLHTLWVGLSVFGASVILGFGLALWVTVLGGDRVLAASWRFAITCFGGTV